MLTPIVQRLVLAAAIVAISAVWIAGIDGSPIRRDASQSLRMALNLERHGVVSMSEDMPVRPSMYREPLPVLTEAAAIRIVDSILGPADVNEYFQGERARWIKYQNLVWSAVLFLAVFWVTRELTSSFLLALLAAVISMKPFAPGAGIGVNSLLTELPGTALLILTSFLLVKALRSGSGWGFALCGAVFGLLALTKAAFLYIAGGTAVLLLIAHCFTATRWIGARPIHIAVLASAFAVIVTPWMARNLVTFGSFQISERGGLMVYWRGLFNQMTADEYKGALYVWAPRQIRHAVGSLLSFSPADLERGGRLQRLNSDESASFFKEDLAAELQGRPDATLTLYRQGRAERVRLEALYASEQHPYPMLAADQHMFARGVEMLKNHPVRAITSVPLFVWRGAPFMWPLLAIALVYGIWCRRQALTAFVFPGFALLCFHALLSLFVPRYGVNAWPVMIVCLAVFAQSLWATRVPATRALLSRAAHASANALRRGDKVTATPRTQ